ncbi:hypothetical protein BH11BAC2_BH11BAC2_11770 [soil metagenome]
MSSSPIRFYLILLLLLVSGIQQQIFAQDSAVNKRLPETTTYSDGLYTSQASFLDHHPDFTTSTLNMGGIKTIRNWFKNDSLFYKNSECVKTFLERKKVWGFYEDGSLYLQKNGYAHKVNNLGELSFFNESYPLVKAPFSPVSLDQTKEITPRLYDFKTGNIMDYNVDDFSRIIKDRDPDLLLKYQALESNKKRRQLLLRFIELYNDKHPL